MNNFPHDCCDDTADLFTHYLYHQFGVDSIRIDGEYYDKIYGHCGHSWQETEGWIIDLTGDQFENDSSVSIKADGVDDILRIKKDQVDILSSLLRIKF